MASEQFLLPLLSYLCAAAALAPTLGELPPGIRLFVLAGFGGGILVTRYRWHLPAWLLTGAALIGTFVSLTGFDWRNPVASFLNVGAVLLTIRLLAEKNRRNYLQLFGLAVFALAAASIIRLDVTYAVALAVLLASGMVALVILNADGFPAAHTCPAPVQRRLVGVGLLLTAGAMPLLLLFFLILPRTQMPLWNVIPLSGSGSGFSEKVQPGKSSTQNLSRRVAFRAEVPAELPPEQLYWRVTVLNRFTGTSWERTPPPQEAERLRGGAASEVMQTIYLEPGIGRFLVGLDLPVTVSGLRFMSQPDSILTSIAAGSNRLRYGVISRTQAAKIAAVPTTDLYRELPSGSAPRLTALGNDLRQRFPDPAERLRQIDALFRRQRLQYATTGLPTSPSPLDAFFFTVRRGNCEFFAGSAGVLLRAAGIPARLVGGYLGGDYSPVGSFYTVTDERAHVWVEALVDGRWQRVDPSRWAVNGADLVRPPAHSLATRLRAAVNLAEYAWTRTVVTYDFQQQLATVDRLSQSLRQLPRPVVQKRWAIGAGTILLVLCAILWLRRLHWPNREERLLRHLSRELGMTTLPPAACLLTLARQTGNRRLQRVLRLYAATLYRGRRLSATRYRRLRKLLSS